MRTREGNQKAVLFVLVALFVTLCLFVPVWQSAVSSQLKANLAKSVARVAAKEDQKMTLKASISKQMTPEYLIENARAYNLAFTQISSTGTTAVASLH